MSVSLDDIPFEILLDFIMPHISIKEVGALAMVNPSLRDMCNDNEIWKVLYLRTVRAKITDDSVHIGAPCRRISIGHCRQKGRSVWKPYQPFTLSSDTLMRRCDHLLNGGSGCKCIPAELRDKLLPWKDVRTDGIQTNEFAITVHTLWNYRPNREITQYREYIFKEWREYNKSRGLSTVNLCQCPEHYVFDSLDVPGNCRNYKSFKKITLRKHGTCAKHEAKRAARQVDRERKEYLRILRIFERTRAKYESANHDFQQKKSLCDKINSAIE